MIYLFPRALDTKCLRRVFLNFFLIRAWVLFVSQDLCENTHLLLYCMKAGSEIRIGGRLNHELALDKLLSFTGSKVSRQYRSTKR